MTTTEPAFAIGDPVKKSGGYKFRGQVRGVIVTTQGETVYAVEHHDHWLFFFRAQQLVLDEEAACLRRMLRVDPWEVNPAHAAKVCCERLWADVLATEEWRTATIPQMLDAAGLALQASRATSQAEFDEVAQRLRAVFERPRVRQRDEP